MTQQIGNEIDLAALLGSRICHDLISPIGAISNGMELLGMSLGESSEEMALVNESVANANTRIRFFRIAYGAAGEAQTVSARDIRNIMDGLSEIGRIRYQWNHEGDLSRPMVKLAFLLVQCLENALPFGGAISVWFDAQGLKLTAVGQNVRYSVDLWDTAKGTRKADPDPATVQFPLAQIEIERLSRNLRLTFNEDQLVVMA